MITNTQKLQILESLNVLDQSQVNEVLAYINCIVNISHEDRHQKFKREAMKEIRKAISHERILTRAST